MDNIPITPEEARKSAGEGMPYFIFQAANEMIKLRYKSGRFGIKVQDIVERAVAIANDDPNWDGEPVDSRLIFDNNWMDIEAAYENVGWKVEFENHLIMSQEKIIFISHQTRKHR